MADMVGESGQTTSQARSSSIEVTPRLVVSTMLDKTEEEQDSSNDELDWCHACSMSKSVILQNSIPYTITMWKHNERADSASGM